MAKVIVLGLAKSGTTGLWSVLVKSYPRRYLQFFEGQYLPSRYNKYFGQTSSEQNPRDVISKQIIGPDFNFTDLASFDKIIWMVRDPRDRLISYLLYRHYDYRYDSDEFVREQLDLLQMKERDPNALAMIDLEARLLLPRPTLESAFFWNDHQKSNFLSTLIEEGRAFIFKYEDFVNQEYSGLENFLGIKMSGNAKVPKQFQRVIRSKTHGFWNHWFTQKDVGNYMGLFRPFLEQYGYKDEWALAEEKKIDPEHCSRYVRTIINERRQLDGLHLIQ
ncbi:hypothetical protein N9444_08955 [Gammaproteobacteria bacterium]|jgi:hypothetical protein|nr:hypothetical protein [Gammaproteobacteria bacterium]MDG2236213.1 hypothetical protein [Arenicellales bacterium]